jgi:ABC-type Fe3+-hydroxamate transport system substrate-binding protein
LKHSFEVVETFLESPEDNFTLVELLSRNLDFSSQANEWVEQQREKLFNLRQKMARHEGFAFSYFIWMNPWMVAGSRTYISNTLAIINGRNTVETGDALKERYPAVEAKDARLKKAEVLLFSSEPFPFKKRHLEEFGRQSENLRPCLKVDGQALSWYGSRFAHTLNYLGRLHAEIQKTLG